MRNKILFSLPIVGLLLLASLTMPVFAQGSQNGQPAAGQNMESACQNGDWEEIDDADGQTDGEDFNSTVCHVDDAESGDTTGAASMMRYY